jgi:hypothetical protein
MADTDHDTTIKTAFQFSRMAVQKSLTRLTGLRDQIVLVNRLDGPSKIAAITRMVSVFARDIAVVSSRLMVSSDPLSKEFRDALDDAIDLIRQNQNASSTIIDEGTTGRCDATNFKPPGTPFAASTQTDPDPRVSVCTPFFTPNPNFSTLADLQRDVITHEFFHLVGLADVSPVSNTDDALRNANTLAQIVAWTNDRFRQKNSDGNEPAIPPLPTP